MPIWNEEEERLKAAFFRWLSIREQETGYYPSSRITLKNDTDKSCLLRRLCDGKEPFEEPPPLAYSGPWYEVLETGKVEVNDVWVHTESKRWLDVDCLNISQHPWQIMTTNGHQDFMCRYYIHGPVDRPRRWSTTLWHVRFDRNSGRGLDNWDNIWTIEKVNQ